MDVLAQSSGSGGLGLLPSIVAIFGMSMLGAWVFRRLHAPTISGFLFTGLVIGPSGFGLIAHDDVGAVAELGLVLLLFMIGLELSPGPLLRMGLRLIAANLIQMGILAALAFGYVGLFTDWPWLAVLFITFMAANSSTAIALKQLSDQGQTNTVTGVITTGFLLVQDISLIALMIVLPLFAVTSGEGWAIAIGQAVLGLGGFALCILIGRKTLPWVMVHIVRPGGREFTALYAVLMAAAGAYIAGLMGWSPALGACVAGLLLSESDERHQFAADIMPFRDVFNALFFCSLGILVDLSVVGAHLGWLVMALALSIPLKSLINTLGVYLSGWPIRPSLQVGVSLCTVSEFSYVLGFEADKLGLLPEGLLDLVIIYAVGTMMIGALIVPHAGGLALRLSAFSKSTAPDPSDEQKDSHFHHVVVVGYGMTGANLCRVLKSTGIPFCIIEMNPALIEAARNAGYPVFTGDATRAYLLDLANIHNAHALVIAINDPQATQQIVAQARRIRPNIFILARTRYVNEVENLYNLGANQVIPEDFETSIEIIAHVLKEMNIPNNIVESQIAALRAGGYAMLRGKPTERGATDDLMRMLQITATRNYYLKQDSPAINKSIAELNLRAATGVTIIAVVRNGHPTTNPQADFRLEAGDVLILLGAHVQLEAAKGLL